MAIVRSLAPQWRSRNLKEYIRDLKHNPKIPWKCCGDLVSSFLFAMGELEEKLWSTHKENSYRFDKIFNKKIRAAIDQKVGASFLGNVLKNNWDFVAALYPNEVTIYKDPDPHAHDKPKTGELKKLEGSNCILVALYQIGSSLELFDVVKSLSQELELNFELPDDVVLPECPGGTTYSFVIDLNINDNFKHLVCHYRDVTHMLNPREFFAEKKHFPIYNDDNIRKDTTQAVFLTESLPVAYNAQIDYIRCFQDNMREEMIQFWESVKESSKNLFDQKEQAVKAEIDNLDPRIKQYKENDISLGNEPIWVREKVRLIYQAKSNICLISRIELSQKIDTIIENVKSFSSHELFYLYAEMNQNIHWSSWVGGFAYINRYDWSGLNGKQVFFVFSDRYEETDRLKHMLVVCDSICSENPEDLIFFYLEEVKNLVDAEDNPFSVYHVDDVLLAAHERELPIPESLQSRLAEHLRKIGKIKLKNYLIEPIIDKRKITLLTAPTNAGKSFLAHSIGYAFATKGSLFYDWTVTSRGKALCISDTEMDEDTLEDRKNIFNRMYSSDYLDNFIIKTVDCWNLEDEATQLELQKMLDHATSDEGRRGEPVRLLILDHLSALTNAGYREENWKKFSLKLVEIAQKNDLAVLLVHHETKDKSRTFGTSFIDNKVHVIIRLEKWNIGGLPSRIGMKVSVPKNRGRKDQPEPRNLVLDVGKHPRWIENSSEPLSWKMPLEEKIEIIKKMREEQTVKSIADAFNVAKVTVEKFLKKHRLTRVTNMP